MATEYQKLYETIKAELKDLKTKYNYQNDSAAFCHLVIVLMLDATDDEANEAVTDGMNDNGIDAVFFERHSETSATTHFFQVKFPESANKLDSSFAQADVLKLINGFETFIDTKEKFNQRNWNDLLKDKKATFDDIENTKTIKLHLVKMTSLTEGENANLFYNEVVKLCQKTGNDVAGDITGSDKIEKLWLKHHYKSWPNFHLVYTSAPMSFGDDDLRVWQLYVPLKNIFDTFNPIKDSVFDGNIRFYDPSSQINKGIEETLKSDCSNFHLLNNGITIICESVVHKGSKQMMIVNSGSVVNGAQTVGCITKVVGDYINEPDKLKKYEEAFVNVKIIEVQEKKQLLGQIVYTLNTQNATKSSYKIANDQLIRTIQDQINSSTEYFLEVKNREFDFRKATESGFSKAKKNVINIETALQSLLALKNYDGKAYLSKNNKASVFDDDIIKTLLNGIKADDLLKAYKVYTKTMEFVRSYRSYRKDETKTSILEALSITSEEIENYRFLNTGNFLIIAALGERRRNLGIDEENDIASVIKAIASVMKDESSTANATRSKETFDKVLNLFPKPIISPEAADVLEGR